MNNYLKYEKEIACNDTNEICVGYINYLKSRHWTKISTETKERYGNKCQICGIMERLQVHHITYDHIGNEYPFELVPLCNKCHGDVHKKNDKNNYGAFIWIKYKHIDELFSLDNKDIFRTIYLSTFVSNKRYLLFENNKQIAKKHLSKLLHLTEKGVQDLINRTPDIFDCSKNGIYPNRNIFWKGKINTESCRVNINTIRWLYNNIDKSLYSSVGVLFRYMRYIDDNNMLCIDDEPMDINVAHEYIGTSCVTRRKCFKNMLNTKLPSNQSIIAIRDNRVYINPFLYYKGDMDNMQNIIDAIFV